MENSTSVGIPTTTTIEPRTVLLYALGLLQSVCGYYLPMSAVVLWWALGIGAFLFGLMYLQYLYSTHFFVDAQVSTLMHMVCIESAICPAPCYNQAAQDMAAFFFVVATHSLTYDKKPRLSFTTVVVVIAFFVYAITMIISPHVPNIWTTIASIIIGALLGITKVLFFRAAIYPICIAWLRTR